MSDPLEQARAARLHSRDKFLDAVDMGVRVRQVTEALHSHYRQNHMGEGLEQIWAWARRSKT